MSKFAVGDKVDKAADDHEAGTVIAVFSTTDGNFSTPSTWKATARCSFSPRENLVVHASSIAPRAPRCGLPWARQRPGRPVLDRFVALEPQLSSAGARRRSMITPPLMVTR